MKCFIGAAAVVALFVVGAARGEEGDPPTTSTEQNQTIQNQTTQNQATPNQTTQNTTGNNDVQVQTAGEEELRFDGGKLFLAWQSENDGDTIKEYIPKGQNLDTWTKLAAVRQFPKINDARGFAELMVQRLHEDSPDAPSTVRQNDKTGEVILDFVAWPKDKSFAEFNVWKLRQGPNGGLVAEQFAVRDYKDPEGFVKNLKNVRERLLSAMAKDGLQITRNENATK